jgi:hypothetical protein
MARIAIQGTMMFQFLSRIAVLAAWNLSGSGCRGNFHSTDEAQLSIVLGSLAVLETLKAEWQQQPN